MAEEPKVTSEDIYVPKSEEPLCSVWATDGDLKLFTNVTEVVAQMNAKDWPEHFFFFAELSTE